MAGPKALCPELRVEAASSRKTPRNSGLTTLLQAGIYLLSARRAGLEKLLTFGPALRKLARRYATSGRLPGVPKEQILQNYHERKNSSHDYSKNKKIIPRIYFSRAIFPVLFHLLIILQDLAVLEAGSLGTLKGFPAFILLKQSCQEAVSWRHGRTIMSRRPSARLQDGRAPGRLSFLKRRI